MNVVFDTSILVDNLRGGDALERVLMSLEVGSRWFLPTVVVMELFAGKSCDDLYKRDEVRKLVGRFELIDMDGEIASQAGNLLRAGFVLPQEFPDAIIAATAIFKGCFLATLNRKHFSGIMGIKMYGV